MKNSTARTNKGRSEDRAMPLAVHFNMYRMLQRHRTVSVPQHGFLIQSYISDRSNAEIIHSTLIFTAVI